MNNELLSAEGEALSLSALQLLWVCLLTMEPLANKRTGGLWGGLLQPKFCLLHSDMQERNCWLSSAVVSWWRWWWWYVGFKQADIYLIIICKRRIIFNLQDIFEDILSNKKLLCLRLPTGADHEAHEAEWTVLCSLSQTRPTYQTHDQSNQTQYEPEQPEDI